MVTSAIIFLSIIVLFTTGDKILKQRHRRKMLELEHRQRMELAQRAEHLVELLLVDKELGAEVTRLLRAHAALDEAEEVPALPEHEEHEET